MSGSSPPQTETMDRGGTDALKAHFGENCSTVDVRQTRRGWCQELFCGCQARSEFKYFVGENQVATSLEESSCCGRVCCQPCYGWKMQVKELNSESELLTVERPCGCCLMACKCCGYQEAVVTSGGQPMGTIKENCFYCVPSFNAYDASGKHVYTIHSPTCCGGCCVYCCAEGNPCCFGRGCCKVPFWIFPADQKKTNGKDARHLGKILKKPKSAMTEIFTEANAFEVHFPDDATIDQKATLVGTSVFFNSLFFEGEES